LLGKEEPAPKPEPAPAPEVGTGTIKVISTPPGAQVSINGWKKCKTPCQAEDIKIGTQHTIKVSATGYQPWIMRFTLEKKGEIKTLQPTLAKLTEEPKKEPEGTADAGIKEEPEKKDPKKKPVAMRFGRVRVITKPPGASLELDGAELMDKTPTTISEVVVGKRHTLRAFMEGRKDWVVKFRVKKKQRLVLRGKLPLLKTKKEKPEKEKPEEPAPAGNQAILSIDCTPPAQVFVDHVQVGNTPLKNYKINPGPHTIHLFSQKLGKTKEIKINAKAGQTIKKKVKF
jgi:hypothetical protein